MFGLVVVQGHRVEHIFYLRVRIEIQVEELQIISTTDFSGLDIREDTVFLFFGILFFLGYS